jgi:pilus assembly protein CpaB
MIPRGLMFGLGLIALLAGLSLSYLWYSQSNAPPAPQAVVQIPTKTVLVAARALPAGTLLRPGDMAWDAVPANAVVGADIVQGSVPDTDFIGAVTRRPFAARQPLNTADIAKPGDREFLTAALAPGYRAVSINVDAVQSTSGLVLPGDRVDVILTQSFGGQNIDAAHRSVGETVLRDLRVIAVDLNPVSKVNDTKDTLGALHVPKTVTLEVTERQAAALLVADQLGKVQLALRGQQDKAPTSLLGRLLASDTTAPVWAADVSKALMPLSIAPAPPAQRRAQIEVIRGPKVERQCLTEGGFVPCQ